MLFASSNQEAVDLHVQAFALAERLSLPVMVCMDGFVLTHAVEEIDVPDQDAGRRASSRPSTPRQWLDPDEPVTIGAMVGPGGLHRGEVPDGAPPAACPRRRAARSPTTSPRPSGATRAGWCGPTAPTTPRWSSSPSARCWVARGRRRRPARGGSSRWAPSAMTCYRPWPFDEVRGRCAGVPRVIVVNRAVAVGSGQHPGPGRAPAAPAGTTVHDVVLGLGGRPVTRDGLQTSGARRRRRSGGQRGADLLRPRRDRAAAELARELAENASPRAENGR